MVTCVFINEKKYILIPNDAIRFRIIPNSNSEFDQQLKIDIKNKIEKNLYGLVENINNIDDARNIIKNNLNKIDNILKEYNVKYQINYGNNYFPEKEYKGIKYNEGNYESLVITLGNGIGDNWWCVLFPPLCLLDNENDLSDVEYEIYTKKLINKFR